MEKILIKWVNEVNWKYSNEWTYSPDGWDVVEFEGDFFLYKIPNSENEIIRNLLTKNIKYKVSFEITGDENDEFFGSLRLNVGGYLSPQYYSVGQYTYISTNPTWTTEFRIISQNNLSKFGIKNLKIESLSYEELSLYENSNISLTMSINDIREYYNRQGTYSKNIVIPGDERNLNFFNYIHDDDIISKINMNKKFEALLIKDDIVYKKGFITIESVDRYDDKYEINILFFGEELNLFKDVGEDLLENLDLSDINHTFTRTIMENTWAFPNAGMSKFTYPWIDYGNLNWSLGGCIGKATDGSPSLGLVGRDFYPAVSLKYLCDKIINNYGYEYEFELSDEDWFKKIIIPYSNERENLFGWNLSTKAKYEGALMTFLNVYTNMDGYWGDEEIIYYNSGIPTSYNPPSDYTARWIKHNIELYRNFNYGLNFNSYETYTQDIHPTIVSADEQSYINLNNLGRYQSKEKHLPGAYFCNHDGKYKMKFKFKLNDNFYNTYMYRVNVYLCKIDTDNILIENPNESFYASNEECQLVGFYQTIALSQDVNFNYVDEEGNITETIYFGQSYNIIIEKEIEVFQNEQIYFKFTCDTIYDDDLLFTIKPDYLEVYEWEWGEGNQVLGKDIVPQNIKIRDFLKDIILLFNLYIEVDEVDNKKLYFKTRQEYYEDGEIIDLSSKLDLDNKIELKIPSEFQNIENIIKYKSDDDYFNQKYLVEKDINKIGYGSKRFIIDNDTISGRNEVELSVFSSTPLWSVWGINGATNKEQFVMSSMWNNKFPKSDEEIQTLQTNWMPRLLFFNRQLIYDNNFSESNDKTRFRVNNRVFFDGMGEFYYPYAGHILYPYDLENVNNYDLNFNTSLYNRNIWQKTFKGYPENSITNNNLFNLYYLDLYNQLSSKNARLFTAYFKLNVNDIISLKLNSTIQLNNSLYLINLIEDFNPNESELTKVELLKIIDKVYPDFDKFSYDVKPRLPFIERQKVPFINSIKNNIIISDDDIIIKNLKSINQISRIDDYDENAIYINNLKILEGEILQINKNIDGGLIETDGVFNPIYFREKHYNDAGLIEEKSILDINIWKLRDGGNL